MNMKPYAKLNCEQVYNVWSTDPDQIEIYDLRSKSDFEQMHIPGAKNILLENLEDQLKNLNGRLAILIASTEQISAATYLNQYSNFALMGECHRWFEEGRPTTGRQIQSHSYFKGATMGQGIIFHQLFEHESSTYTYLIADSETKEAALIDPVIETVERDLKLIAELGLKLVYVLDTHIHADHITAAGELRKRSQAKTAVSFEAEVNCVDIPLEDGQELFLGKKKITAIATPGHTNTCMTFLFEGMAFTGDALLIRGCGRTDFQQGSSEKLYDSVHHKIFQLPETTIIYPGHDYRGHTSSTVFQEKQYNPRLNVSQTKTDFVRTMSELKLAQPKKIHEAVPANLGCGLISNGRVMHPQVADGIPEVSVEDVFSHAEAVKNKKIQLIDVRRPEEFNNELGHIQGSLLVTLGDELTHFLQTADKNSEIIFVCRSGGRSGQATMQSIQLGFKKTANMVGGMIRWNEKKQPVERN